MTAVEKLELRLLGIISFDSEELRAKYKEAIKQAKEMEEEQKGYSEEEVENILIEYVKTNPTKPYRVVSWFQQIKKK